MKTQFNRVRKEGLQGLSFSRILYRGFNGIYCQTEMEVAMKTFLKIVWKIISVISVAFTGLVCYLLVTDEQYRNLSEATANLWTPKNQTLRKIFNK